MVQITFYTYIIVHVFLQHDGESVLFSCGYVDVILDLILEELKALTLGKGSIKK